MLDKNPESRIVVPEIKVRDCCWLRRLELEACGLCLEMFGSVLSIAPHPAGISAFPCPGASGLLGAGASADGCGLCGSCDHQRGCLRLLPLACADGVHPQRVIQGLCVLHVLAAEPQVLSLAPSKVWAGPFKKLRRGWEEASGQFNLCLLNTTLVESAFSRGLVRHFAFPCQCPVHTSGP